MKSWMMFFLCAVVLQGCKSTASMYYEQDLSSIDPMLDNGKVRIEWRVEQ